MAGSKRERAVSAAGLELEKALGLHGSVDVLSRWMAYRLAELREAVEQCGNPTERKILQAEQDQLIVSLWEQRGALPVKLGYERRLGKSLEVLGALADDVHRRQSPEDSMDDISAIFSGMSDGIKRISLLSFALLHKRETIAAGPEDPDLPMTKVERKARARISEIAATIVRRLQTEGGKWSREPPTDDEAISVLEDKINAELIEVSHLLARCRNAMLGQAEKKASKSSRKTKKPPK